MKGESVQEARLVRGTGRVVATKEDGVQMGVTACDKIVTGARRMKRLQ